MRHDIADQFEKRIKSRFSHRQINLFDTDGELFKSLVRSWFNETADSARGVQNDKMTN